MYFRFLSVLFFLTTFLFAQTPPPEQEQALRANVQKFYQSMQDGKFRGAYALVADDSQESFMEMAKPKYTEWKIDKIEWSEDFKKATVTLDIATDFIVGGQKVPVRRPLQSHWRNEGGDWIWYHIAQQTVRTPFGVVKVNPGAPSKQVDLKERIANGPKISDLAKGLEVIILEPATLTRTRKSEVQIKVKNGLEGYVEVSLQLPKIAGLSAKNRIAKLRANEEAVFTVIWTPQENSESPTNPIQGTVSGFPIGGSQSFGIYWAD